MLYPPTFFKPRAKPNHIITVTEVTLDNWVFYLITWYGWLFYTTLCPEFCASTSQSTFKRNGIWRFPPGEKVWWRWKHWTGLYQHCIKILLLISLGVGGCSWLLFREPRQRVQVEGGRPCKKSEHYPSHLISPPSKSGNLIALFTVTLGNKDISCL